MSPEKSLVMHINNNYSWICSIATKIKFPLFKSISNINSIAHHPMKYFVDNGSLLILLFFAHKIIFLLPLKDKKPVHHLINLAPKGKINTVMTSHQLVVCDLIHPGIEPASFSLPSSGSNHHKLSSVFERQVGYEEMRRKVIWDDGTFKLWTEYFMTPKGLKNRFILYKLFHW